MQSDGYSLTRKSTSQKENQRSLFAFAIRIPLVFFSITLMSKLPATCPILFWFKSGEWDHVHYLFTNHLIMILSFTHNNGIWHFADLSKNERRDEPSGLCVGWLPKKNSGLSPLTPPPSYPPHLFPRSIDVSISRKKLAYSFVFFLYSFFYCEVIKFIYAL